MKTRLPFSTISYNTESYLRGKLKALQVAHVLSEWYYIHHMPEDDEAGKKEHFHVFMLPARSVQTEDIREALVELDPQKPDKPRKCLSFRSSKFGHWYMYAIHDTAYLASKGESRKHHYRYEDIVAFDDDVLHERFCDIDLVGELGAYKSMEAAMQQGLTFAQYFNMGRVPINQTRAYQEAWELMLSNHTHRADRDGHDLDVDPETGEVL